MPVPTLPLGDTGTDVSALGLGTLNFGSRTDRTTSIALLNAYTDAGGTFLDTANCYSYWVPGCVGGESESLLGAWMRQRGNRDRLFVATKVFNKYPGADGGLAARQIETECEKSLERLQTDVIDLYYAHTDDREVPLEETLEALDRLVRAGKVRHLGASNFRAWRLERARRWSELSHWAPYCCIQQSYTYLRARPGAEYHPWTPPVTDDLLDFCRHNPVPLIAYSPLLKGAYDRDDRPIPDIFCGPDTDARLAALGAVAEEVDARPTQVVLAWMRQSSPPVIPLFAASTLEQLQSNLQALEIHLTGEQMERLDKA